MLAGLGQLADQQQLVAVAQGCVVPGRVALAGDHQQAAGLVFQLGHPVRQRMGIGRVQPGWQVAAAQDPAGASFLLQGLGQLMHQARRNRAFPGRAQADGVGHARGQHRCAGGGRGQAAAEGAQDRLHQLRLHRTDLLELGPAQTQQLAVTAGHHIGGALGIGEEGNLPHRFATADLGHQQVSIPQHVKPAAQHVVQAVGLIALVHHMLALAHAQQLHLFKQHGSFFRWQIGKQRY